MGAATISIAEQAWAQRNSERAAARLASETLLASADTDPHAAALARVVLCYLDYRERRYEQAAAAGLEALALLEANPADPWLPRLYNTLAIIHFDLGERATSREYLDRQIRLSHELGDRTYEALGYHDLGLLQAAVDPDRGLATLAQARAMFRASGDAENEGLALYNMANIHQHAGEREQAASYASQALQIVRASGTQGMATYLTVHIATLMAELASGLGNHGEAQALLNEAHAIAARHLPELMPSFTLPSAPAATEPAMPKAPAKRRNRREHVPGMRDLQRKRTHLSAWPAFFFPKLFATGRCVAAQPCVNGALHDRAYGGLGLDELEGRK